MSNVILPKESIVSIADAIRNKTNSTDLLYVNEMPAAIESISGGDGGLNLDNVETRVFSDRCSFRDIEDGSRDNYVQGEISPVLYDLSDLNNIVAYDSYDIHIGSLEGLLNEQIQTGNITSWFTEDDAKFAWNLYSEGDISNYGISAFFTAEEAAEEFNLITFDDLENKPEKIFVNGSDLVNETWPSIINQTDPDADMYLGLSDVYSVGGGGICEINYATIPIEDVILELESRGYTVTK